MPNYPGDKNFLEEELVEIAHRVFERKLTAGTGGNISVLLDNRHFLITRSGSSMGFLRQDDILKVDFQGKLVAGKGAPSTETPVHAAIYRNLHPKAIIHSHPPFISGLALTKVSLSPLIFEPYIVLEKLPVIPQQSFNVIGTDEVVESLKNNKVVILLHHGVIAIGDTLLEAFFLTDLVEANAKTIMFTQNLGPIKPLPGASSKPAQRLSEEVELFSPVHQENISKALNQDKEMETLGKSFNFTTTLCLFSTDNGKKWYFSIKKGKILSREAVERPDFLFSGTRQVWERVFTGRMAFFGALFQGRITMEGDVRRFSSWYLPFQCFFETIKVQG